MDFARTFSSAYCRCWGIDGDMIRYAKLDHVNESRKKEGDQSLSAGIHIRSIMHEKSIP